MQVPMISMICLTNCFKNHQHPEQGRLLDMFTSHYAITRLSFRRPILLRFLTTLERNPLVGSCSWEERLFGRITVGPFTVSEEAYLTSVLEKEMK